MNMITFWLVLMIAMIVIEALAPGLVSIWFAFGALISLISVFLHAPVWLQFALFGVVSAVTLVVTRPLVKKYVNGRTQPTNADMIIGKECVVIEDIDNIAGTGSVSVGGKFWTARSTADELKIPAGSRAIVEKIEGVKAIVSINPN